MGKNKKNKNKIRTEFRKNHEARTRSQDLTRDLQRNDLDDHFDKNERVSGKGRLTRKRTIIGAIATDDSSGFGVHLDVDTSVCVRGRVLSMYGLTSRVQGDDGRLYRCATRRLLKSLSTDQRHVVAAGDIVWLRPENGDEGFIERIEPRHGTLCRTSKGRLQVLVANVDQVLIVGSAAEPGLKPNLIDRFIITSEKSRIRPIICINKIDLVDAADLQPIVGVFAQMGYTVLLTSVKTGRGISRLRELVAGKETVVAGQSGVGKSSLLNVIEAGLQLRVNTVSTDNEKGRHTTTTAQLIPLQAGGFVVDTPGIRQFQLWGVSPEEVIGYLRDLRPFVHLCRYPDCTHVHETDCAIKDAVADGKLDARRYESYIQIFDDPELRGER